MSPNETTQLSDEIKSSPLYSTDLAPVPVLQRNWNKWNLAALWVGMAVCIPTYLLASYMIKSGISWQVSLLIIGLANLVITLPMVFNGDAGVRYGIPFPVAARAAFGTKGVHIPSFLRAIVACGWFGVQTWIGGLALYSIWNAIMGNADTAGLDLGKFVGFAVFWLINMYFVWKGTEAIKWLEDYSAPILILIGIILIAWAYNTVGSFGKILEQSEQLSHTTAQIRKIPTNNTQLLQLELMPLRDAKGTCKAQEYQISLPRLDNSYENLAWTNIKLQSENMNIDLSNLLTTVLQTTNTIDISAINKGNKAIKLAFRAKNSKGVYINSSVVEATFITPDNESTSNMFWNYVLWFTAMVGFWATMSISISDITRFAKTQTDQVAGQFIGLPLTMIFYSFVGIFVTSASVLTFDDLLLSEDAPWNPVSLVAKFNSPFVIIFAQTAMLIATLSTNIAANIIAPAYAFSNMFPKKISFRVGGIIAGVLGIVICPWWLLDELSNILIFISALLAPVLGILLCDYFIIRKKQLNIAALYQENNIYTYSNGYHLNALIAMIIGIIAALIGKWIPALDFLFSLSWFTGFGVAFGVYYVLMHLQKNK